MMKRIGGHAGGEQAVEEHHVEAHDALQPVNRPQMVTTSDQATITRRRTRASPLMNLIEKHHPSLRAEIAEDWIHRRIESMDQCVCASAFMQVVRIKASDFTVSPATEEKKTFTGRFRTIHQAQYNLPAILSSSLKKQLPAKKESNLVIIMSIFTQFSKTVISSVW
jgi:hypothetical protein